MRNPEVVKIKSNKARRSDEGMELINERKFKGEVRRKVRAAKRERTRLWAEGEYEGGDRYAH